MNSFQKNEDLNDGKEYIRPQNIKEFILGTKIKKGTYIT